MKIDLRKLYGLKKLDINEDITIPEELYQKMNVRDLSNVNVNGTVIVNIENNIELNLNISGTLTMPCSITNEDVLVPFNTTINEEIEENSLKDDFYLDLLDILWENIVLEIPFNVVKEGAKITNIKGDGWEFTEE